MARRPINRSKTDFENSVTPPERKYDPAKYEQTVWSSGCQQTYLANTRESHPSKYEAATQSSGSSFGYSAQQSIPSTSGYSPELTSPAGYEEPYKTRGGPVSSYPSQQTTKKIVYSNSGYPPQTSNPINSKEEYEGTYNTNYVSSSSCGPPAEAAKVVVCSVKSRCDAHLNQQPKQAVSVESASYGIRGLNHHDIYGSERIRGRQVAGADAYRTSSSQIAGKYRSSTMLSPHQDISGIVFKLCTCTLYTINRIKIRLIECNAKCRHRTN
jgi:hypothetical protein